MCKTLRVVKKTGRSTVVKQLYHILNWNRKTSMASSQGCSSHHITFDVTDRFLEWVSKCVLANPRMRAQSSRLSCGDRHKAAYTPLKKLVYGHEYWGHLRNQHENPRQTNQTEMLFRETLFSSALQDNHSLYLGPTLVLAHNRCCESGRWMSASFLNHTNFFFSRNSDTIKSFGLR